jgi:multicomponent Na+:H+ antiporter subunit G
MSGRELAVACLVAAAVALELLACAGVLLMRDALDRLHYTGPATVGGLCAAAAVLVQGGWSLIGMRAILLGVLLVVTAPVLTHATAKAIHRHEDEP